MKNAYKILLAGLDYAGKTSILTALNKKYNFQNEIIELKPTIKVQYNQTTFLGNLVFIWDAGGQSQYRELYQKRKEIYFAGTDLLVYIIDVQDNSRYEESLNYLDNILHYFVENEEDVPVIISFHKYDPEIRNDDLLNSNILKLKKAIVKKYPNLKILFQQTSIYDIISIVQLVSYGLSVFDKAFFDLSELIEDFLIHKLNGTALLLFDENGVIISEFYGDSITPNNYVDLIESIQEHLFLLKRMQEENYMLSYNFFSMENKLLSYLHTIKIDNQKFYISAIMEENLKENLLNHLPDLIEEITRILQSIVA
jgi:small GTP-binding protein